MNIITSKVKVFPVEKPYSPSRLISALDLPQQSAQVKRIKESSLGYLDLYHVRPVRERIAEIEVFHHPTSGAALYRNNMKNRFPAASAFPRNSFLHLGPVPRQCSLAPEKNFGEPPCRIPDSSSCFGIPESVKVHLCEMEKKACEAKSSAFWECVGRKLSRRGDGFIYLFKARREYDDSVPFIFESYDPELMDNLPASRLKRRKKEIFPALELSAFTVQTSWKIPNTDLPAFHDWEPETPLQAAVPILQELGYRTYKDHNENVMMEIPDLEALLGCWEHLRMNHPMMDLPILSVISSDGIADDISYATSYFSHDAVLSLNKEFVHDHHYHLIPILTAILDGKEEYIKTKAHYVNQLKSLHRYIENLQDGETQVDVKKYLSVTLGMLTDSLTSVGYGISFPSKEKENFDDSIERLSLPWRQYVAKRFSESEEEVFTHLLEAWKEFRKTVTW
ncbi:MAG TPA: hypothetical protein VJK48_04065 [Chlamydiales bacterium]|nr:hypothetical protein [Chlamydiales bacterium]